MESFQECLVKYRRALRNILSHSGVPSNPAVEDDWILDQVSLKLTGKTIPWAKCDKCGVNFPGEASLLVHKTSHDNEKESEKEKDTFDLMKEHVLGAQQFGYKYMVMPDVLNMIELAKSGKLAKFTRPL